HYQYVLNIHVSAALLMLMGSSLSHFPQYRPDSDQSWPGCAGILQPVLGLRLVLVYAVFISSMDEPAQGSHMMRSTILKPLSLKLLSLSRRPLESGIQGPVAGMPAEDGKIQPLC